VFDSQTQIKLHHSNLTVEEPVIGITVKLRHLFNSLVIEFLPRVSEVLNQVQQLDNWARLL
jgi:hypothetical protein